MQHNFEIKAKFFYNDHEGARRKYGIYVPSIDRFLHISDDDVWMSLQAAGILSSKIQTTIYVLPPSTEITNDDCLMWGIYDKSSLNIGSTNVLSSRQSPSVKMLYPTDKLLKHDEMPEQFNNSTDLLLALKTYADFVYGRVTAINLAMVTSDPFYSNETIVMNLPDDWPINKTGRQYSSYIPNKVKNILYVNDDVKIAEQAIVDLWKEVAIDKLDMVAWDVIKNYYTILGESMPGALVPFVPYTKYTLFEKRLSDYEKLRLANAQTK